MTSQLAGSAFGLLSEPRYRLLWLNCFFLQIAFHLAFTVQGVVAFDITGKNSAVGFVAFAQGSAVLISTPLAGVLSDRFAKRVLLVSEVMMAASAAAVCVLILSDAITIVLLAGGALFLGAGISAFWPALNASMVAAVDPAKRPTGAGFFQVAVQLTRATAPFVAAGLLALDAIGSGGTFLIVALVYIPVLFTASMTPAAKINREPRPSLWHELRLGLSYVGSNRPLFQTLVFYTIAIAFGFSILVVLPAFTREVLGAGRSGFGIMFGFNAVGALLASALTAPLGSTKKAWGYLLILGVCFGLSLSITGLMPTFPLAVVAMFFAGAFGGGFQTVMMSRILHLTEQSYFGRVTALTSAGWSLTNVLSLLVGGVADLTSERTVLISIGLALALATVLLSLWTRDPEPSRRPAPLTS